MAKKQTDKGEGASTPKKTAAAKPAAPTKKASAKKASEKKA